MYHIVHQTPNRVRIQFDIPLTESICVAIEQHIACAMFLYQIKWYKRTPSVVFQLTPGQLPQLIERLNSIDPNELIEAFHHPIEETVDVFDIFRDEFTKHLLIKWFVPTPIRRIRQSYQAIQYIRHALIDLKNKQLTVDVLDATAIIISMIRSNFETAGSIMFLLQLSDKLEHHTRRKSYNDLKKSLALSIDRVWQVIDNQAVEVQASQIKAGDIVIVNHGNMIPFDGIVTSGTGFVNEASLTGEAFPIRKTAGDEVFANTVLGEGDIQFKVTNIQTDTAIAKLVDLISQSEETKSSVQKTLETQADGLVKYNFIGATITYLLTRNLNRALTFMLVDFSCALRLIGPLINLTAMKEASDYGAVVKGSKFIENFNQIDTFIFDKTGTLTNSTPTVVEIIPFEGYSQEEVIRIAACLEEHYHHPIAAAIVQTAIDYNITHEEMHEDLRYIVAHGIESSIDQKRVVIGSKHFILEDEEAYHSPETAQIIEEKEKYFNLLYLAYDGQLIAIFVIDTQIRPETADVLYRLKRAGKRICLLTGDQADRAQQFAEPFGFDEVLSQLLPEEKFGYIQKLQHQGHKVAMIGDGINDSAAISLADIGIVMKESSDLARQVSDIVLMSDDLNTLFTLETISHQLNQRLKHTYQFIIGFNSFLIGGGVFNILSNTTAAMLHNTSTVATAVMASKRFNITQDDQK
ncbi:heavy metal translocating P-type ATPase [Atopobacter phocae]|uniref:heavy metal translocating P-type ATPase n=1 Tax=Atopobacter phocae TaxID=136492 RepID=UPI0004AFB3FE|nr:heavy metal translocating P-type ATPase [Atopobacter phocae]